MNFQIPGNNTGNGKRQWKFLLESRKAGGGWKGWFVSEGHFPKHKLKIMSKWEILAADSELTLLFVFVPLSWFSKCV